LLFFKSLSTLFCSFALTPCWLISLMSIYYFKVHPCSFQFHCHLVVICEHVDAPTLLVDSIKIVCLWFITMPHIMSQPHFWKSVRMTLTLSKWGLGNPSGLSKLQSWIAWVKTPHIGVFFISLESYESVNVENELAWAIWTFAAQVMCKRKAGSQTGNLTPDH
jgi:hypothetical protein